MRFFGGLLLGLILGVGATWFLTATDRGRAWVAPLAARISGAAHSPGRTAAALQPDVSAVLAKLQDAAGRAEEYAGKVASGVKVDDIAAELKDAAAELSVLLPAVPVRPR